MTKSSFTATDMASPCKQPLGPLAPLAPGRFDRSSANSEKPLSCIAIRSKKSGQGLKGFGADLFASPVFSPSSRSPPGVLSLLLPSLLPSFPVPVRARLALFPRLLCRCRKRIKSAALHVQLWLHYARFESEEHRRIAYRRKRKPSSPSTGSAMPWSRSMVIGVDAYNTNP
jgi:hypothetical protein